MGSELIEVVSTDGTVLGAERLGVGPPLLAVHGGTADRSRWAPVREALAERFTVYLLDRRGRGASRCEAVGEYHLGLEADDALAVIAHIGEPTFYLGHSYGALIGLEALTRTDQIRKAFLYEPPFDSEGFEVAPRAFVDAYAALIDADRRDDALDLFYTKVIGIDPTPLHGLPIWQARKLAAHTLVREADGVSSFTPHPDRYSSNTAPTLILLGTESPPVFGAAARLAAAAIPTARIVDAKGFGHLMIDGDPAGFVSLVTDFFLGAS
jgi:pimeloyl-ACP methyl ester carboxylesterase